MAKFAVPEKLQQFALMVGIVIAIVLRACSSGSVPRPSSGSAGSSTSSAPSSSTPPWKLVSEGESDDDEYEENRFMKFVESRFPATKEYDGTKLFILQNGKRLATPLFFVIIALGTTDLLFALDSIPAIYGLTKEPYIVLTANLFALMGLRQLYFLIGGLLKRLVYLSIGLAVLLAFIGVKLLLHALHENELPFINGGENVPVPGDADLDVARGIVLILGTTTVLSLMKTRRDERDAPHPPGGAHAPVDSAGSLRAPAPAPARTRRRPAPCRAAGSASAPGRARSGRRGRPPRARG